MVSIDTKDLWRQIPPEEKLEAMSLAQSKGFLAVFISIITCSTLAVGFKSDWLMWTAIVISPLVFQFTSGKAWRAVRPRLMLEYLAARSAARRYAFNTGSKNLDLSLMFRGHLEVEYTDEQEDIEAGFEEKKHYTVWISLFQDVIVIMSERIGGADLRFAALIDNKFSMKTNEEDVGEYSTDKVLELTCRERQFVSKNYKVTSKYSAALIAFEKAIRDKEALFAQTSQLAEAALDDVDDLATDASFDD